MTPGMDLVGPISGVQDKGADVVPLPSLEQVREFIRASKSENTLRGYHAIVRADSGLQPQVGSPAGVPVQRADLGRTA